MPEIGLERFGRVAVSQRQVAVGIGYGQAHIAGQHHGLDHRKSLGGPVAQVAVGFLPVEAVEKLPGRVAQIEEGGAVGPHQVTAVFTHPEVLGLQFTACRQQGGQRDQA
jgi:hypothetical protein